MHLIEVALEKPLMRLACAHHVCERYYDAAVKAKFGTKTDSPSQTQCLLFKKWFAENRNSLPDRIIFDPVNPPLPFDDPFFRRCRGDLEALKERLEHHGGQNLPRGDYVHLWELVQVMLPSKLVECVIKKVQMLQSLMTSSFTRKPLSAYITDGN